MSQQIEEIFAKYKKVFITDQENIKKYLLTHYERALLTRQVINVERIDNTERIKISGFSKYLSSWRNFYQNIVVTSCILVNNVQKRYDYKFYFTKEKLDNTTIDKIERALEESARLRRNFKFDEAIAIIDEMLELIEKKKDEVTNKILNDVRKEIVESQEKYDKDMLAISKLENKIKVAEDYDNLRDIPKNCENIIKLAESIGRNDLVKKYKGMIEETQKEIEQRKAQEKQKSLEQAKVFAKKKEQESYEKAMAQIAKLEEKIKTDREAGNLKVAINDCEKIINIANLIDKYEFIVKYSKLLENLGNELEAKEAREREMAIKSKEVIKKQKAEKKRNALEAKEALKKQKAEEKQKSLEAKEAAKRQKAEEKQNALEAKEALKKQKEEEKRKALEAEEALKKQKAEEERQNALEAEEALKKQKAEEEKQNALEAEEVLRKQKAEEERQKTLEAEETLKKQKAEEERQKTLEAEETLKKQKAMKEEEKRKALEAEEALKKQKVLEEEKRKALEAEKAIKAQQEKEREKKILEQIAALEKSVRKNQKNDILNAVVSDCKQIINLANSIDRGDIAEKYRKIMDDALKSLEERKAQEKQKALEAKEAAKKQKAEEKQKGLEAKKALKDKKRQEKEKLRKEKEVLKEQQVLEKIAVLEESVRINQEIDNLDAVVSDCRQIIKLANSIVKKDIAEEYRKIMDETQTEIEKRKAEEILRTISVKETVDSRIVYKEVITNKFLIILCIIGGILIITHAILDIILLISTIYTNIVVDIRIANIRLETRETFFIFLLINGCICIVSGALVILGSIGLFSNKILFGRAKIIYGIFIALIGAPSLLIVGVWAGSLSGNFASLIMIYVFIYFIICLVGVVFIDFALWRIKTERIRTPGIQKIKIRKRIVAEKKPGKVGNNYTIL